MWHNIDTLNDLIEILQEMADFEDEDGNSYGELPVRIAYQQNWPLVGRISAVTACVNDDDKRMVWLAENPPYMSDNPYAPKCAWNGGIEGEDFAEGEEW